MQHRGRKCLVHIGAEGGRKGLGYPERRFIYSSQSWKDRDLWERSPRNQCWRAPLPARYVGSCWNPHGVNTLPLACSWLVTNHQHPAGHGPLKNILGRSPPQVMPQGRPCTHSPEMGQPRSKVPLALGRGNHDHTRPSDRGCGCGLKAETCCDCRLCPQMKAPQGTSRERTLELSAEAALADACSTSRSWKKNRQNPNSSPRQPQAVPLTTR